MQKAEGVPMESMLGEMGLEERWPLLKTVAEYQISWTKAVFQRYGSLYYEMDLRPTTSGELNTPPIETIRGSGFAIGPSTGMEWNDCDRRHLDFDRGPCKLTVSSIAIQVD